MGPKQAFAVLSVILSCYLIFSLSFVSAYQMGELQNTQNTQIKFIMEPFLRIVDELKPVNCESSGYVTFRAYVENVPEFGIKGSEAFVEDVSKGETYNVTSSLSCYPKSGLISNQEITCSLKVNELLSRIPSCPFEKFENRFYLALEISYGEGNVKISTDRGFVLTESGIEPSLEVKFDVAAPPYDVPEINCRTGSEIDVPVLIKHAETFYGEKAWSFSVNRTDYGGNLIECEKMTSREGEGREDVFLCTFVIYNTAFARCEEGYDVLVEIKARTSEQEISGNFTTYLVSGELNLGLSVSDIEKLECQIIKEDGTCVPKEPQQNVTVRITGNVPERLRVFETRYRLGDENITTTYCRKIRHDKYECLAFITLDSLPVPETKYQKTAKSRELTFFFDVKYLNYYTNISDSTNVEMEGTVINEILNTKKVLEEKKGFLEWAKKNAPNWIEKAFRIVDFISGCCLLLELVLQMTVGNLKGALKQLLETYLWGTAEGTVDKIITVIVSYGPSILGCIADKGIGDIKNEMTNLEKFENNQITNKLEIPGFLELIDGYVAGCVVEGFWDRIKTSWMKWACAIFSFLLLVITHGAAAGVLSPVCEAMESPAMDVIKLALNLLLMAITYLIMQDVFNEAMQSIAMVRERINVQQEAGNILTEYGEAFSRTMETLAMNMAANAFLQNITYPSYDTVELIFMSDRTGVLDNRDEICVGDAITIDYNFEKLNQTEGFISRLLINPSNRGPLNFEGLKGTYGPQFTETLLGTEPDDPSEMYTFTLAYQDRSLDYELYYTNHTCI